VNDEQKKPYTLQKHFWIVVQPGKVSPVKAANIISVIGINGGCCESSAV